MPRKNASTKRSGLPPLFVNGARLIGRTAKWIATGLVVLMLLPVLLVPLYLVVNPVSTLMMARTFSGQRVERDWRDIEMVSDRLKTILIMSEDGQYCRHAGIDLGALRDEINALLAGEGARGASTLTMQVSRNLFLWQGRSFVRKALEIPLALYIDLVMPKQRIMEIYLNIAEWGPDGEFGIEAGVQRAFGIDSDALTWERASLMVTALPNPHERDPANPTSHLRSVAKIIEERARTYADRAWCVFDENGVPDL